MHQEIPEDTHDDAFVIYQRDEFGNIIRQYTEEEAINFFRKTVPNKYGKVVVTS